MFRVVPDQLRISEGWVRCGQCEEVFDANAHLRTLDPVAPRSEPVSPSSDALDWGPVAVTPPAPVEPPAAPVFSIPAMEDRDVGPLLDESRADAAVPAFGSGLDAFLGKNPHDQAADEVALPLEPDQAQLPSLSFMSDDTAPALRGPGNMLLMALCVCMVLSLSLQVLIHNRDRLAATAPALRPLLAALCVPLACRISAPRQIEALAIESSSFTSVKPGVYVLHAVLKNAVPLELATPALEISLTDTQDQALLRKVLLPMDVFGKPQISGSSELSVNLPLGVQSDAVVTKIAGYKLLAFYP